MKRGMAVSAVIIVLLVVAIVAMSIGFANFSETLEINGTADIAPTEWSVHFDDASYNESGTVAATNHNVGELAVTYDVTLAKPGDTYSFTVDVINDGDFDAELTSITLPDITTHANYLTHKVSVGGTEFTNSDPAIASPITLASGDSVTVKVDVQYLMPANEADLPSAAVNDLSLSVALGYTQVTD